MKKFISIISDWFNDRLRHLCALLSPENRLMVIFILMACFLIVNVYFMADGIRMISTGYTKKSIEIEHLTPIQLKGTKKDSAKTITYVEVEKNIEKD